MERERSGNGSRPSGPSSVSPDIDTPSPDMGGAAAGSVTPPGGAARGGGCIGDEAPEVRDFYENPLFVPPPPKEMSEDIARKARSDLEDLGDERHRGYGADMKDEDTAVVLVATSRAACLERAFRLAGYKKRSDDFHGDRNVGGHGVQLARGHTWTGAPLFQLRLSGTRTAAALHSYMHRSDSTPSASFLVVMATFFLKTLITDDEKWITYDRNVRKRYSEKASKLHRLLRNPDRSLQNSLGSFILTSKESARRARGCGGADKLPSFATKASKSLTTASTRIDSDVAPSCGSGDSLDPDPGPTFNFVSGTATGFPFLFTQSNPDQAHNLESDSLSNRGSGLARGAGRAASIAPVVLKVEPICPVAREERRRFRLVPLERVDTLYICTSNSFIVAENFSSEYTSGGRYRMKRRAVSERLLPSIVRRCETSDPRPGVTNIILQEIKKKKKQPVE
ncbi:hypothetical protein EVAR_47818_1 [Eumeta japonica]|uniref:Uncharacterized protein n=1 Tax=Eumeta variegata TaxID=151549 RepID=A0A4C1YVI4_EUMVA|nr:hypothetical protein EVAR_47818_1 [Eumeta japonica]